MWWRRIGPAPLALLVGVLVGGLSVLADASPPDPWWDRGVYDDADFDDVVGLILATSGLVDGVDPVEGAPDVVLIGLEVPPDDRLVPALSLSSSPPRAPPAS